LCSDADVSLLFGVCDDGSEPFLELAITGQNLVDWHCDNLNTALRNSCWNLCPVSRKALAAGCRHAPAASASRLTNVFFNTNGGEP